MHHHPAKNVLHVVAGTDSIAAAQGRPKEDVERDLEEGLRRLRAARSARKAPFVDPVLYANWNGMAIRAALEHAAISGDTPAKEQALRALDRFLREAYTTDGGFQHTIGGQAVHGLLDDQAQMLPALVAAFHATQEKRYLERAREVAEYILREFLADDGAGFFDTARSVRAAARIAVLQRPERPLQDSPSPSANARALEGLLLVADLAGDERLATIAGKAVGKLADQAKRLGLFGSALTGVVLRLVMPPAKIVVAGPKAAGTDALRTSAWRLLPLGGTLLMAEAETGGLPEEAVAFARGPARTRAGALVCLGQRCLAPAHDEAALRERLATPP